MMSPDNSALPTPPSNDIPEQPQQPLSQQNPFEPFPSDVPPTPEPVSQPQPVMPSQLGVPSPVVNPAFNSIPSTAPAPTTAPTPVMPQPQPQPKRRFGKKWLLITIVVAVVLLGGGATAVYAFYYQNPNKVVSDAIFNIGKAKTVDTTSKLSYSDKSSSFGVDANISYDQQSINASGNLAVTMADSAASNSSPSKVSIGFGGYINKDGTVLLKLTNIEDIMKLYMSLDANTAKSIFGKFDNKWISFDNQSSNSSDATQQCFTSAYDKFSNDKSQQNEVLKAYQDNLFLVIDKKLSAKTINGVGSLGYQLHLDANKFYAFINALKQTTLGKAMSSCDSTVFDAFNKPDSSNDNIPEYDVYISRFGHQLTQISSNFSKDDQKLSLTIDTKVNANVKITKPKADTDYQTLLKDIESSYIDYYLGSSSQDSISFGV